MSEQITQASRLAVSERSGGRCEVGWRGCTGRAVHKHHRRPRGAGGTSLKVRNAPAVLVDACAWCHGFTEAERAAAECLGLIVTGERDWHDEPVFLRGIYGPSWRLLADDGTFTWTDPPRDASLCLELVGGRSAPLVPSPRRPSGPA